MIEDLLNIIKANPISYGAVSFLTGLLIGNRLAIGRDKRKEFNEAACPIREVLLQQLHGLPRRRYIPDAISNNDFISFSIFIGTLSKNRYFKDVEKYLNCFELSQCPDAYGHRFNELRNSDFVALEKATKSLLKYCKLK